MELKDFIGKVVICTSTKYRYVVCEIKAYEIEAKTERPDKNGYYSHYCWETQNGDPISRGYLTFEDQMLNEPFKEAYEKYSRTEDARWERYGYWLFKE